MSEQTNTQNVCPICGGPGYHVRGCQLGELRDAHRGAIIAQSQAVDRAESAERECKSLHDQLDAIEDVLMRTEAELNVANKAANEAEAKVSLYATAARVIALHLKEFCDESLPYDQMVADAARKAAEKLQKAKEWNALCELELKNLRSRIEDAEEDMSIQGVRMGEAQESIYALKIMLLELCEKMESGISGPEETKRARLLLNS